MSQPKMQLFEAVRHLGSDTPWKGAGHCQSVIAAWNHMHWRRGVYSVADGRVS